MTDQTEKTQTINHPLMAGINALKPPPPHCLLSLAGRELRVPGRTQELWVPAPWRAMGQSWSEGL